MLQNEPTVLFVDDDPNLLEGIARSLHKEPYQIMTAQSGSDALEIMANEEVDVIVADYNMPNMNGTELLTECRQRWPDTPRIMLTGGNELEGTFGASFGEWAYKYVEKPIQAEELATVVLDALLSRAVLDDVDQQGEILVPTEVHEALMREISASVCPTETPERPTLKIPATALEWAKSVCASAELPPELDRFRPLIEALDEISDMVQNVSSSHSCDEVVANVREVISRIS